jgi:hypothetical protein
MGYRSTVILGIPPKQKEEFENIIRKHNKDDKYFKGVEDIFKLVKEDDDMLIYEAEYLKWYTGFDDVEDITKLIEKQYEKDEESCFILGIGEDGVIHSELGYYYDHVGTFTTHEIY